MRGREKEEEIDWERERKIKSWTIKIEMLYRIIQISLRLRHLTVALLIFKSNSKTEITHYNEKRVSWILYEYITERVIIGIAIFCVSFPLCFNYIFVTLLDFL